MSADPPSRADGGGSPKLASRLAYLIYDDIAASGLAVGEVFGSEPDLIARYGVSRAVFREAIRLLEHWSVAAMRKGHYGGLVVCEPTSGAVRSAALIYLNSRKASAGDLMAVITELQCYAARRAAEVIDDDGAERLRSIVEDEERFRAGERDGTQVPPGAFRERNLHLAIAAITGNPVLELFDEVTFELSRSIARRRGAFGVAKMHRSHRELVDAIVARDPNAAEAVMRSHLQMIAEAYGPESSEG